MVEQSNENVVCGHDLPIKNQSYLLSRSLSVIEVLLLDQVEQLLKRNEQCLSSVPGADVVFVKCPDEHQPLVVIVLQCSDQHFFLKRDLIVGCDDTSNFLFFFLKSNFQDVCHEVEELGPKSIFDLDQFLNILDFSAVNGLLCYANGLECLLIVRLILHLRFFFESLLFLQLSKHLTQTLAI